MLEGKLFSIVEVDDIEYNFDNRGGINLLVNTKQLIGTSADGVPGLQ